MKTKVEQTQELRNKIKTDNWGYHSPEDVRNYRDSVYEIKEPLIIEMIELKEKSEDVKRYFELQLEQRKIDEIGRSFNLSK